MVHGRMAHCHWPVYLSHPDNWEVGEGREQRSGLQVCQEGPSTLTPRSTSSHSIAAATIQALGYQRPGPYANQVRHVPHIPPQKHMSLQPIDQEEPHEKSRLYQYLVAEQTFAWFRGYAYANVLNDMRSLRHRFAALLFCAWHNDLILAGKMGRLNQFKSKRQSRKTSRPYS